MKSIRGVLTILCVVALCPGLAIAAEVTGEILRAGLCEHRESQRYEQPQSTAGYATLGNLWITDETDSIPLQKDISFGFVWRVTGLPPEAEVQFVVKHPTIRRPDGKTLTGFVEPLLLRATDGVVSSTDCYSLSEDHELVSGKWTIEVAYEGQTLVSKTFTVKRQ